MAGSHEVRGSIPLGSTNMYIEPGSVVDTGPGLCLLWFDGPLASRQSIHANDLVWGVLVLYPGREIEGDGYQCLCGVWRDP